MNTLFDDIQEYRLEWDNKFPSLRIYMDGERSADRIPVRYEEGFSHYDQNFDMSEEDRSELIGWFSAQDELPFWYKFRILHKAMNNTHEVETVNVIFNSIPSLIITSPVLSLQQVPGFFMP